MQETKIFETDLKNVILCSIVVVVFILWWFSSFTYQVAKNSYENGYKTALDSIQNIKSCDNSK
jgi:hypothetical protein